MPEFWKLRGGASAAIHAQGPGQLEAGKWEFPATASGPQGEATIAGPKGEASQASLGAGLSRGHTGH